MAEHTEVTAHPPRDAAAACEPQGLDAQHEARGGEAAAGWQVRRQPKALSQGAACRALAAVESATTQPGATLAPLQLQAA